MNAPSPETAASFEGRFIAAVEAIDGRPFHADRRANGAHERTLLAKHLLALLGPDEVRRAFLELRP